MTSRVAELPRTSLSVHEEVPQETPAFDVMKRMFLSFGLHMMKARALLSLLFLLLPSVAAAQSCDPTPSRQLSSFPGVHVLKQMTLVHQPLRPATTAQVPGRIKRSA